MKLFFFVNISVAVFLHTEVGRAAVWSGGTCSCMAPLHSSAHSREAEGGYSFLKLLIQLPPKNVFEINTADAEVRHYTVDAPQYEEKNPPYCTSQ